MSFFVYPLWFDPLDQSHDFLFCWRGPFPERQPRAVSRGEEFRHRKSMGIFGVSRNLKQIESLKQIEQEISSWPGVTAHSHRFGGREFRLGSAEIGHVHNGGDVDIPFPRAIHDALLAEGLAERHRWVPDSGWTTFRVWREDHLKQALWLLRLSYLRYALKKAEAPQELFERECQSLKLNEHFRALLLPFVPQPSAGKMAGPQAIESSQQSA